MTSPEWRAWGSIAPIFIHLQLLTFIPKFISISCLDISTGLYKNAHFPTSMAISVLLTQQPLGADSSSSCRCALAINSPFWSREWKASRSRKYSPPTAGGVSAEPEPAHGRREQRCSLHVDYSLSAISFSSGLATMVNGLTRVLQKAKYHWGQDGADLLEMLLRASWK